MLRGTWRYLQPPSSQYHLTFQIAIQRWTSTHLNYHERDYSAVIEYRHDAQLAAVQACTHNLLSREGTRLLRRTCMAARAFIAKSGRSRAQLWVQTPPDHAQRIRSQNSKLLGNCFVAVAKMQWSLVRCLDESRYCLLYPQILGICFDCQGSGGIY